MKDLLPLAERAGGLLKARRETIGVAESASGGLISATLLAVPGASVFFIGGAVVYTRQARAALLGIPESALAGMRPSTESYAVLLARTVRERFCASWGLAETGAAGPAGNRYGDAPGHACIAIAGSRERAITIETGSAERAANMRSFVFEALTLLIDSLEKV
jgi:PncC family amidohydrolase